MEAKIKVEKFLMAQGVRVGKAAIEFTGEGPLNGFHLVGFTLCYNRQNNNRFIMLPMAKTNPRERNGSVSNQNRTFFFLRPDRPELLDELANQIWDVYDSFESPEFKNVPRLKQVDVPLDIVV